MLLQGSSERHVVSAHRYLCRTIDETVYEFNRIIVSYI